MPLTHGSERTDVFLKGFVSVNKAGNEAHTQLVTQWYNNILKKPVDSELYHPQHL